MHCGPLMVDADKMAKSLGNCRTIRQTIAQGNAPDDQAEYAVNLREAEMLRFFIVRNHYRSPQNYAPDNLFDAQNALDRLYQTLLNVPAEQIQVDWAQPAAQAFRLAMDDDFNTSGAVAALFELASDANRTGSGQASGLMRALGGILGLLQSDPAQYLQSPSRYHRGGSNAAALSGEQIQALIDARAAAKKARDFAEADRIRDELQAGGIELEDKAGGVTQWRRA